MKSRLLPFSLIRIQCRLVVFGFVVFCLWVNPDNIVCWQTKHTGLFQIPCLGLCPLWTDRKYYWSVWQNVRFLASLIQRLILFQICTVCQWPCSWASFVFLSLWRYSFWRAKRRRENEMDFVQLSQDKSCRYCCVKDTFLQILWYSTMYTLVLHYLRQTVLYLICLERRSSHIFSSLWYSSGHNTYSSILDLL